MKKRWVFAIAVAAMAGGLAVASGPLQKLVRQTLLMTSADPDVLGLVRTASMEPITLTLRTRRFTEGPGYAPTLPADHRISFRVPAAAVSRIYLKEGSTDPQGIEFTLWHRTLDPVAPDRIADSQKCRVGKPCYAEPQDRGAQRKRDGEHTLQITIGNGAEGGARRVFMLETHASIRSKRPCTISENTMLGMLVAETPDGMRPGDACEFTGNPGIRTRDGRSFPPRSFLRRTPDGAPQYAVRCHNFASEPEERAEIKCRLTAYFGIWQFSVLFFGMPPTDWDSIYHSVIGYLGAHVVDRTGAATPH